MADSSSIAPSRPTVDGNAAQSTTSQKPANFSANTLGNFHAPVDEPRLDSTSRPQDQFVPKTGLSWWNRTCSHFTKRIDTVIVIILIWYKCLIYNQFRIHNCTSLHTGLQQDNNIHTLPLHGCRKILDCTMQYYFSVYWYELYYV